MRAFAVAGELDVEAVVSNTCQVEWPPRSGRRIEIPEVDRAQWFDLHEASEKINPGQRELLGRLGQR